jgi:hypothetical protein
MSEIRKIQPIDADASLSDRRKLRAMTPLERQLNARELARQEAIKVITTRPVVRCEMVDYIDEMGERGRRPAVFGKLPAGMAAGVSLFAPDGSVYVSLQNVKSDLVPKELDGIRGIVAERPTMKTYDQLYEPFVADLSKLVGHRSYAHPYTAKSDAFAHTENPLSGNVNWSAATNESFLQSDGSKVVFVYSDSEEPSFVNSHYYYNTAPGSADYSAEATVQPAIDGSSRLRHGGPSVRQHTSQGTCYRGLFQFPNSGTMRLQQWNDGIQVNLSTVSSVGTSAKTIRIEVVGQVLVVYYAGESGDTLTATDNSDGKITDTGYAGIHGTSQASSTASAYFDDWKYLTETPTGGGPFRTGPFREGPFKRGAFR